MADIMGRKNAAIPATKPSTEYAITKAQRCNMPAKIIRN
jgi:hypothetical protein